MKYRYYFQIFLILCVLSNTNAQDIVINEALASNSIYLDEDGDASDWFELYNKGEEEIDLSGWTVTDNLDVFDKWELPETNVSADSYILIWASGKDRTELNFARNYIKQGDHVRYLIPNSPVDQNWKSLEFDDSQWLTGILGIGYGDGDDATIVESGTRSVYLRKTFSIRDVDNIEELILDIDYDDSFVAYLNGVEIARSFISGQDPAYNTVANGNHEALMVTGGQPERYYIANPHDHIQNGSNVLTIQAHNVSSTSSDFSIIPFLSAVFINQSLDGDVVPEVLQLSSTLYHTNFKLSAGKETIYLFDSNGQFRDSLFIEADRLNVSIGLDSERDDIVFYQSPTPGFQNITASFKGVIDAEVLFSHEGGETGVLDLELSSDLDDGEIRYTINSTIPNENSPLYTDAISMTRNIAIRARYFKERYIPSKTFSRSYLPKADHDLPIISLITEPNNLYSNTDGIYVRGSNAEDDFPFFGSQFWEDWERPVHFSFYDEDGVLGELTDAGIKIFGGWSRGFDQKSFSLFARKEYGSGKFKFPFFKGLAYSSFESLVLRNSGNDWGRTMMRDATLTSLLTGADLEFQAYQPTVVYVNGSYWGIYNLREKINEHFVASKKGVDADDVTILEQNSSIIRGDNAEYKELINFVTTNDLSIESSYSIVADKIDIDNFALYFAAQIYFDNTDWPGNNIKYWKTEIGKWRWILFDTDFGFGIWDRNNYNNNTLSFAMSNNGPGWPNPPWSTLLFRQLNENKGFTHIFINQMADAMNSRFLPDHVSATIENNKQRISSEVADHYRRWNLNFQAWDGNIENMKNFGNRRPRVVKEFLKSTYNLPDFHKINLEINNPASGYILVNNRLEINQSPWNGDYFETVPIKITAIAKPGSVFSRWEGDVNATTETIIVDVNKETEITAVFNVDAVVFNPVVINEINYKSSPEFNTDDWIELHNVSDNAINLSNWSLKDADENLYTIPVGTEINADDYLILTKDLELFKGLVSSVHSIGDIGFGLSSKGDKILLFDQAGFLQDEVEYDNNEPWPDQADGEGFTLELINPELDNSLAENWMTLNETGSPGRANTESTSVFDLITNGTISFYPIPTSDELYINLELNTKSDVSIQLVSIDGKSIMEVIQKSLQIGIYNFNIDLTSHAVGLYTIQAHINGQVISETVVKN